MKNKIKYNFDVETISLKIDKCLNAKLLKFNMLLHYMLNSLLTSIIHTTTHYWGKAQNILTYQLLLHNTLKPLNKSLNK